jgi:antitoxin CptB
MRGVYRPRLPRPRLTLPEPPTICRVQLGGAIIGTKEWIVDMTGMTRSSEGLDLRRRKALYHAWHRGTREMDLVLGRFADAEIHNLDDGELGVFELLMEAPDRDLFSWMTGSAETPANYDTPVFRRIRSFYELQDQTSA